VPLLASITNQREAQLPLVKEPVALDPMRTLELTLDSNRFLNPGKVISPATRTDFWRRYPAAAGRLMRNLRKP
jgi:hypothetical protein